ncbi:hypothetical protein ACFSJY_03760 [Thalassotalea euphylliae]|uniref:hypothetical protein n=1 Tax=Thalassotalea euphylliae TaxID=1655234 RepID=UPI0036257433
MAAKSNSEKQWLADLGLVEHEYPLMSVDNKGLAHTVIPDLLMADVDGNFCIVEFKDGNCLTTDGARGGKAAADNKKENYINNPHGRGTFKQRLNYASNTMGWNHSGHKMVSMANAFGAVELEDGTMSGDTRIIVVDPKMDKHKSDLKLLKRLDKFTDKGVELMTPEQFTESLQGGLQLTP